MASKNFPTRMEELSLNDSSLNPSLYASIRKIRKSALSLPHRFHSILADAEFAKQVSNLHELPLVANERCGSWYINPAHKAGSAYFKSTDGHHGQWSFSLRRLNLQLLPLLGRYGGAVVVDSTRRGKNLPDAFSKTVPIWVAVINRTLFPELSATHRLQAPPAPCELGRSEVSQIDARLEEFAQSFRGLGLDLPKLRDELKLPIGLSWVINGYFDAESQEQSSTESLIAPSHMCRQLVLCSASHRVYGAEGSEAGYIQGAGDDSEAWSCGLTPELFWKHRDQLMTSPEDDLPEIIEELLNGEKGGRGTPTQGTHIDATRNLHIAPEPVHDLAAFDLVINCNGSSVASSTKVTNLDCRSGKIGSKDLREKLPGVVPIVRRHLLKDRQSQILVTCATGTDLSVGVAVSLLCLFYQDNGQLKENLDIVDAPQVDKLLVKQRLAWISSAKSNANPSRATLQAVNSFLMRRPD
ncbi:tRNA A64-2'-O-ribosylphosphate transferase [Exophiala xenobiotica]|nr:tRNA A64-2'-O-ribosylphosphate transferase [Exophiala xenobiotica]